MQLATTTWSHPLKYHRPTRLPARTRDEIGKRRFNGESARDLAVEFGVSASYIYSISLIEN